MSERQSFRLVHDTARKRAVAAVANAPEGYVVTVEEPTKKRAQEEKYHAMVGDIADQCEFMGRRWDRETWKRLLVDAFARVMRETGTPLHHDGAVIPSLDGQGFVQLGIQTRKFYVKEAAAFTDYLYAFGNERGVRWTEPVAAEPA